MSVFKKYEIKVLELLVSRVLSPQQVDAVVRDGTFVSYEYSGCGYFLTAAHPSLPKERTVCHQPIVMGHTESVDCGFVIFIENGELIIECHTLGAIDVPEGFRDMDVKIEFPDAGATVN